VVNIASVLETKRRMLSQHESQRAWLQRQHGIDHFLDQMTTWSRQRGALAGFESGEGFRHYTGHPWPQEPLLEELIGADLVATLTSAQSS
jgi:N-acetylglucosamine malate deacetylase 1